MIRRMIRRARAQGMTEYIIIVGLVAILLVAAVTNYKEQIRVTIMGSVDLMDKEIEQPLDGGNNPPPANNNPADGSPAGRHASTGDPVFHDGNGGFRDASGGAVNASDVVN